MYFWKFIIGAVAGAALVKESEKAGSLYDSIRGKLVAALKKIQEKPQGQDTGRGATPENTSPA
jgi:hypothetical protein